LPFHKTGKYRRARFADLTGFKDARAVKWHEVVEDLARRHGRKTAEGRRKAA
jgi:hypothetical protein